MLGQATQVRRTDERSAILEVLHEADDAMGPREIAVATGADRNNVDQLLYKMMKEGEIRKAKRGRYIHPDRLDLIEPEPSTPGKNGKKIRSQEAADPEDASGG